MPFLTLYIRLEVGDIITAKNDTTYFGGFYYTKELAEQAARDCVNYPYEEYSRPASQRSRHGRPGTILPRVFELKPGETMIDAYYRACEWFEKKLEEMNETALQIAH